MKIPSRFRSSKRCGFTLVELLVVIAIIAILAGVLAVSAGSVLNSARRARASATANQIQTAILNYDTEYGVLPAGPNAGGGTAEDYMINDTDEADWGNLMCALCGNFNPANPGQTVSATGNVTNTRAIAFLNMKTSDVDSTTGKMGAPVNPVPAGTGAAATALYFNIAVGTGYHGILGVAPSDVTNLPNFANSQNSSTSFPGYSGGGSTTAAVAIWANCTGKTASITSNANFWVHTY
jgi:prepilin-type N-terminal cleavage/methylation domain-containing protein